MLLTSTAAFAPAARGTDGAREAMALSVELSASLQSLIEKHGRDLDKNVPEMNRSVGSLAAVVEKLYRELVESGGRNLIVCTPCDGTRQELSALPWTCQVEETVKAICCTCVAQPLTRANHRPSM